MFVIGQQPPEKKKRNRTGEKTAKTYIIGMINLAAFTGGTPVGAAGSQDRTES